MFKGTVETAIYIHDNPWYKGTYFIRTANTIIHIQKSFNRVIKAFVFISYVYLKELLRH